MEHRYLNILSDVKKSVNIPVSIKLAPFFSSLAHVVHRLDGAGADGIVFFSRPCLPDINLETLEVVPGIQLSDPGAARLPARWIAALHGTVEADLAASGGVHSAEEVLKMLMAGARVTMMTSALLRHGIAHVQEIIGDLTSWLASHGYDSISQLRGRVSQHGRADSAFERASYVRALCGFEMEGGQP